MCSYTLAIRVDDRQQNPSRLVASQTHTSEEKESAVSLIINR